MKIPPHDFSHALRVLNNAEYLSLHEGSDLEVIIPAALFHDLIVYQKNDLRSKQSAKESAEMAQEILSELNYPQEKIVLIKQAIIEYSYS